MKKIVIEPSYPFISVLEGLEKETVEKLCGEFIKKGSVRYGVFFAKIEPTDELIIKAIKLYELLRAETYGSFVIKGEFLEQLMKSTRNGRDDRDGKTRSY